MASYNPAADGVVQEAPAAGQMDVQVQRGSIASRTASAASTPIATGGVGVFLTPPRDPAFGARGNRFAPRLFRGRWLLFCLVLAVFICAFNGQWRISRDSAAYRGIARNLARDGQYVFRPKLPNVEDKQDVMYPGLPYFLAGLDRLIGVAHLDSEHQMLRPRGTLLVMYVLAGLALLIIYRLMRWTVAPWLAVAVVCGTGLSRIYLENSNEILTDIPSLLGIYLALYGLALFERQRKIDAPWSAPRTIASLAALIAGLAIAAVMRPTFWIIAAALFLAAIWWIVKSFIKSAQVETDSSPVVPAPKPRRQSFWHGPRAGPAIILAIIIIPFAIGLAVMIFNHKPGGGGYFGRLRNRSENKPVVEEAMHRGVLQMLEQDFARAFFATQFNIIPSKKHKTSEETSPPSGGRIPRGAAPPPGNQLSSDAAKAQATGGANAPANALAGNTTGRRARGEIASENKIPARAPRQAEHKITHEKVKSELQFGLTSVFSLLAIIGGLSLFRRDALWGLIVLLTLGVTALFGTAPRYYLMILPLLLVGWGDLCLYLVSLGRTATPPRGHWREALLILTLGIFSVPNFVQCLNFIREQRGLDSHLHHTSFLQVYQNGGWLPKIQMAKMICRSTKPSDRVLGPEATVLTYLSDRPVYELANLLPGRFSRGIYELLDNLSFKFGVFPPANDYASENQRIDAITRLWEDKDSITGQLFADRIIEPGKEVDRMPDGDRLCAIVINTPSRARRHDHGVPAPAPAP